MAVFFFFFFSGVLDGLVVSFDFWGFGVWLRVCCLGFKAGSEQGVRFGLMKALLRKHWTGP